MSNYSDLLKDPQWQKMRLKILERDQWSCQSCYDTTTTLHVHHRRYIRGKKPWEYSDDDLVTLCANCHEIETEKINESIDILIEACRQKFLSADISNLAKSVMSGRYSYPPDVMSSIIERFFIDGDFQDKVTTMYFETLRDQNGPQKNNRP